jgi:hypothetical protein
VEQASGTTRSRRVRTELPIGDMRVGSGLCIRQMVHCLERRRLARLTGDERVCPVVAGQRDRRLLTETATVTSSS